MKAKQPRKVRSYKMEDATYDKAMKMAAKRKEKLAVKIQEWVTAYSQGLTVVTVM